MMDYFSTHSPTNDSNFSLTAFEIASSMIPVITGMAAVGLIAILMLL